MSLITSSRIYNCLAASSKLLLFNSSNTIIKRNVALSATCRVSEKWLPYNEKVFPPQGPDEVPRPAYVCHLKENIRGSPKRAWYAAVLIRGLRVDDAIHQMQFLCQPFTVPMRDAVIEAQRMGVKEHNVEFPSNLWVAESFVGKGPVVKTIRRGARGKIGICKYRYFHFFVRLEEGDPPEHYYYHNRPLPPEELLENWVKEKRERHISLTI